MKTHPPIKARLPSLEYNSLNSITWLQEQLKMPNRDAGRWGPQCPSKWHYITDISPQLRMQSLQKNSSRATQTNHSWRILGDNHHSLLHADIILMRLWRKKYWKSADKFLVNTHTFWIHSILILKKRRQRFNTRHRLNHRGCWGYLNRRCWSTRRKQRVKNCKKHNQPRYTFSRIHLFLLVKEQLVFSAVRIYHIRGLTAFVNLLGGLQVF